MSRASQVADAYGRYGPALVRKAERILRSPDDAEDVVHGLFSDLLARPPRSIELPYLYRAIGNRCLNRIRDHKNRQRLLELNFDPSLAVSRSGEDSSISLDLLARLTDTLDSKSLEVMVCLFIDDMSQEEAASFLRTSRRTVGKRLKKVRETMATLAGDAKEASA